MRVKLFLIAVLFISANIFAQQEVKPTKEQQEIIEKAKPIEAELKDLKVQVYDIDKTIEYYTKLKVEANKKIEEKVLALQELQKQFDALKKEEKK